MMDRVRVATCLSCLGVTFQNTEGQINSLQLELGEIRDRARCVYQAAP